MSTFIPYPAFHDDVPVDISFVFESERPAGKHGFLRVAGRDFVFDDGTKVKFWGTNFNGAGCFPEHDYAKKLARRLAKLGLNIVRMHQLDSEWHTPNIFAYTKGKRVTDAHLDPESMDRLDFLIKCLKEEGIYVYMDMFTYRKFRSDEGAENAAALADAGKPYNNYSRKLIELQKELAWELWTHENKYTGIKYCDEPAIVLAEIVNESDLFYKPNSFVYEEPYKTELLDMFSAWLKKRGIDHDYSDLNVSGHDDDVFLDFKRELQIDYYREMTEHMRAIGVKIPITGTNWSTTQDNYLANITTDYLDIHPYFYDWHWGEFEKSCMNRSVTQEKISYLARGAFMSHANMPTYVSEWDAPWPNEFRADSVLYSAAYGLLQGWSGFAIHTYSYSARLERMDMLGKEISAEKIGNVPYRQGIFSAWNDPAKFGLFYHAALMTRRDDVKAADAMCSVEATCRDRFDPSTVSTEGDRLAVVNRADNSTVPHIVINDNGTDVTSVTGELYRNYKDNYGKIDTAMTKCAYGFLSKNGEINLAGMSVKCKTDFAVIAASSLTDKPISESDNILLTTVGRAMNTDAVFEGEKMIELGKPPILIENIEAEIEIETVYPDLKVWAISAEGYYIGTVPTSFADGKLTLRVGDVSRTMYYLLVRD